MSQTNVDQVLDALRPIIEARVKSHPGTQHSNLGGWQSSWDFADWGGAPAARIIAYAR